MTGYTVRKKMECDEALDFFSELPMDSMYIDAIRPVKKMYEEALTDLSENSSHINGFDVELYYENCAVEVNLGPLSESSLTRYGKKIEGFFEVERGYAEFLDIVDGKDWK
jgi:hypothetical protein